MRKKQACLISTILDERYYGKTGNLVFIIFLFFTIFVSDIKNGLVSFHVSRVSDDIKAAALFIIGAANGSIDNSVSEAIKRLGQISLTKNIALPEKNN